MASRRAKVLDDMMFAKLMVLASKGENSLRDQVMILLSYKAGLRASEIAGLNWKDVTDAEGAIRADALFVPGNIAKYGRERTVPMNPHLYTALLSLRMERPDDEGVIYGIGGGGPRSSARGHKRMSADAVTVWFRRIYAANSFEGCSSHSGRRTFITRLARKAGQHDCSIKDVQLLAGHARLDTTEKYIDPSPNVMRLVAAI
jgi:integrase/recombinase XerD